MFFHPRWYKSLAKVVPLTNRQIKELDKIRKDLSFLSDEEFLLVIRSSTAYGNIIIRIDYKNLKRSYPDATEKEILRALLIYENEAMKISGSMGVLTDEMIPKVLNQLHTLEDFINYVGALERKEQPLYYTN
jgi:hypothetical protein